MHVQQAYHLGQYEPSYTSTKWFHAIIFYRQSNYLVRHKTYNICYFYVPDFVRQSNSNGIETANFEVPGDFKL